VAQSYTPVIPGETYTMTAAVRLTAGAPLAVMASGQVRRVAVTGDPYVGIAAHDCEPGDLVTVHTSGPVHEGRCALAVTAGNYLLASWNPGFPADRQVTAWAPTGSATDAAVALNVLGIALNSGADGDVIRWLARV
jgi:hypothetical protein